ELRLPEPISCNPACRVTSVAAGGGNASFHFRYASATRRKFKVFVSDASVESRMGAVAWAIRQRSVSHPRSSNRTCRFPASGSPTGFVMRHTKQITNRKRHLCGVLSFFASRHSFL